MLGITLRSTLHGNPGRLLFLPTKTVVKLDPATNLPETSPIKYWAQPYKALEIKFQSWPLELKHWAESVGVGLEEKDVHILKE